MRKRLGVGVLGLVAAFLLLFGGSVAFGEGPQGKPTIPFETAPVQSPERLNPSSGAGQSISPGAPESGKGLLDWLARNWGAVAALGFGLAMTYVLGDKLKGITNVRQGGWGAIRDWFRGLRDVDWLEESKAAAEVAWMWVQENAPSWWQSFKDFGRGVGYEVANNVGWGIPDWLITGPLNRTTDESPSFAWGRAVGSIATFVIGIVEVIGGIGGGLGGGGALVLSFGTAAPVAVPAVVASWGLILHGGGVVVASAVHAPSRFREAIYYSKSGRGVDNTPPETIASDPEVVEPLEPNWMRHQKNVTGRTDVAEVKGKVELDGKVRKVQWDDLQVQGGDWWGVDAKHIDFERPFYKTSVKQGWAWRRWEGQLRRQQAWARLHGLKGVKWVFSQEPPEWFLKLYEAAVNRGRLDPIEIEVLPLKGG